MRGVEAVSIKMVMEIYIYFFQLWKSVNLRKRIYAAHDRKCSHFAT